MSIFITGATGFLGTHLLPLLAARQKKLLLFVRNKEAATIQFANTSFRHQLILIQGDLYKPSLGINEAVWRQYKDKITEIWHCGANLSFNSAHRQEVMHCNLTGTIAMLEKAKQCNGLKRFYYVSTAFVHGNSNALIKEDILIPGNTISFLNHYEESKYKTEEKVRTSNIPFCIFRPAIIMGHSTTGEAGSLVTYFGFYTALKKAFNNGRHIAKPGEPLHIEGINGHRNHICVDHAATMMNEIALSGKDANKTFHLAYAEQGRVSDIFNAINHCLGSNFILDEKIKYHSYNLTELLARRFSSDYRPYILRNDPVLDRSNTLSVLEKDLSLHSSFEEFLYKMYTAYNRVMV